MRRTAISDMTLEQASDELVMMEVKKLLQKAKKAYKKAQEAEAAVFHVLEWDMCLDMDVPSEAENADTLGEAVACWLNYEEYTLKDLLAEIRAQYTQKS